MFDWFDFLFHISNSKQRRSSLFSFFCFLLFAFSDFLRRDVYGLLAFCVIFRMGVYRLATLILFQRIIDGIYFIVITTSE